MATRRAGLGSTLAGTYSNIWIPEGLSPKSVTRTNFSAEIFVEWRIIKTLANAIGK